MSPTTSTRSLSHDEIARHYPGCDAEHAAFQCSAVRVALLKRGGPTKSGFACYAYRPFDNRSLYWEAETKLLDEKRSEYWPHAFAGNLWLVLQKKARPDLSPPLVTGFLGDLNQME